MPEVARVNNDFGGLLTWVNAQVATGTGTSTGAVQSFSVEKKPGYNPTIVFKLIKKQLGVLENIKLERRIKRLEKAFYAAVDAGHDPLANKFLNEIVRESKESAIYARGFKHFIEKDVISKYKHKIRGGHISDTYFSDYTRHIPKDVLALKKKSHGLFDNYVIYHYWSDEAKDVKKMSPDERSKMRDPILFGTIKETNRLYFVADWEDEFCDFTFDELIDAVGEEGVDVITRKPSLA
jgi:hypothetical protein